ncbi:alanine racemase [Patescibacteria group bacterium]
MLAKFFYYQQRLRRKMSRKLRVLNTITLSKNALRYNYRYFKKLHKEAKICPVLKSNAYGHGLIEIAKMLDPLDPPYFVVDSFYEAFELQKAGVKTPSLIIGYTHPKNYKYMKFKDVAVTMMDKETVIALGKLRRKIKVHLKVDTGMHRQGVPFDDVEEILRLIKTYKNLELEGICTHLADADNGNKNNFTQEQVKKFKKVLKIAEKLDLKPKWKHISATAGAGKVFTKEFNMVRLGLGIYGESSLDTKDKHFKKHHFEKLKPVMTFQSTIIDIKDLEKGDCVSYGCTFIAPKKMKIGIVPAGYYEGIDRRLSDKGYLYFKNKPCKILGRVCMNLTVVDLSNVKSPKKWDPIEVVGNDRSKKNCIRWMADTSKTIPYVLWINIAPTIRRIIKA